jgi:hypothetical protein
MSINKKGAQEIWITARKIQNLMYVRIWCVSWLHLFRTYFIVTSWYNYLNLKLLSLTMAANLNIGSRKHNKKYSTRAKSMTVHSPQGSTIIEGEHKTVNGTLRSSILEDVDLEYPSQFDYFLQSTA